MAVVKVTCAGCGSVFEAKTPRAKWCGSTCRQRDARSRKAASANAKDEAKTDTPAEHGLVKAVRTELEAAGKDQTFSGQLALQLARRLANPEETGTTALSKELRAVMADALATAPPAPESEGGDRRDGDDDEAEDDEVTRARRQREEARAAAGLA